MQSMLQPKKKTQPKLQPKLEKDAAPVEVAAEDALEGLVEVRLFLLVLLGPIRDISHTEHGGLPEVREALHDGLATRNEACCRELLDAELDVAMAKRIDTTDDEVAALEVAVCGEDGDVRVHGLVLAEGLSHRREGRGPRTSLDRLGDRQPDPGVAVLEVGRVLEDPPQQGRVVEAEQGNTALEVLGLLRRDVVDADDVLVQPGGHLGLGGVSREATEQEGATIIIRSSLRTISTRSRRGSCSHRGTGSSPSTRGREGRAAKTTACCACLARLFGCLGDLLLQVQHLLESLRSCRSRRFGLSCELAKLGVGFGAMLVVFDKLRCDSIEAREDIGSQAVHHFSGGKLRIFTLVFLLIAIVVHV